MFKRYLAPRIVAALKDTPVVFINGARQCGKSTLAKQMISTSYPAKYLSFDDIEVLTAARSDPSGFIAGLGSPVILDEVQHLPALFPAIKAAVDRERTPGRFLLTGSTNISLIPELSKSLVGRIEIFNLWPLSQGEIDNHQESFLQNIFTNKFVHTLNNKNTNDLTTRIVRGGYPEVIMRTAEARKNAWFQSYINTILQRDIQELSRIEGLTDLPRLLKLIATRTAALLNFAELSRTMQFPQTTLKRYMALLEGVFLISLLPAWSNNLSKRLVKSPKIMLNDTGLLTFLLGYNAEKFNNDSQTLGPILENFVLNELRKQNSWNKTTPLQFFHFRTQAGEEVDILIENAAGETVGIEIKNKKSLTEIDFKGLRNLAELLKKRFHRGILLYNGENIIPFGKNMHAVPIHLIWD